MIRNAHRISWLTGAGFLFVFKAWQQTHSWLRNCCRNTEDGLKDQLAVKVISCTFLNLMELCSRQLGWKLRASIILLLVTIQSAAGAEFSEDQVKAVYLINFSEFIRWPDSAFSANPKQFTFCALQSETPVISILVKVIANESARGRKLVFKQLNNPQELGQCQVFYFHQSDRSRFIGLLPQLKQKNILTVSDDKGFIEQGGMIAITRSRRRLHPTINVGILEKSGLKASAKLLRLATIVKK